MAPPLHCVIAVEAVAILRMTEESRGRWREARP
jgi:hypothetical protein